MPPKFGPGAARVGYNTDFSHAVRQFDRAQMEELLAANPALINKIITRHPDKVMPLGYAIFFNSEPLARWLIDHGADVNGESGIREPPLYYAIKRLPRNNHRLQQQFEPIISLLIESGADVNKVGGYDNETPLHMAVLMKSDNVVNQLIDAGANVNAQNLQLYTPLHYVIHNNNVPMIRRFAEAGANPNIISTAGTVIYHAVTIMANDPGYEQIVNELLDVFPTLDVNIPYRGNSVLLKLMDTYGAGDLIMKVLNRPGVNVNFIGPDGAALHEIVKFNLQHNQGAYTAVLRNWLNKIIEVGGNINIRRRDGKTPLHLAVTMGQPVQARMFVEKGAEITDEIREAAAGNPEMLEILGGVALAPVDDRWKGFSKSDMEKFHTIFDPDSPVAMKAVSVCPVCLKYSEHREACLYMSHNCSTEGGYYHRKLYNKYKNEDGTIFWCTICARICLGHSHYRLGAPGNDKPDLIPGGNPFGIVRDASKIDPRLGIQLDNGCGGYEEKIMRLRAMRSYAAVLQPQVDVISHKEAMDELVEAMWLPSQMPRIARAINTARAFNTPLNVFHNNAPPPVNAAAAPRSAPEGSFEAPEIIPAGTEDVRNAFTFDDDQPMIRFIHKNEAGTAMHRHDAVIHKDSVLVWIKNSGAHSNRCFEPAECNGFLWPDEVEAAFAHPLIAPSVTDEDRAKVAAYRERFYRNLAGGKRRRHKGGSSTDVFQPAEGATCAIKVRKGGKKTRRQRKNKRSTRKHKH